ncbi:MAG: DNA cytosine methyltransferase [Bacteroidia bacterium]|nr:DNA cytosine methyltransferase [Bacteroidia bacterium]
MNLFSDLERDGGMNQLSLLEDSHVKTQASQSNTVSVNRGYKVKEQAYSMNFQDSYPNSVHRGLFPKMSLTFLKSMGGGDFSKVLTELSSMGYNAEWRVCTASEVGAPHHRERMYLVAYPESIRLQKEQTFFRYVEEKAQQVEWLFDGTSIQTFRGGYWLGEPPAICVANGVSNKLPGYTDSQWRIEMYKAFGNAVVPQIPFKIFKAIREHQKLITNS